MFPVHPSIAAEMIEFLVLGGLIAVGLALAAIFVFAWFLLKLVLWAVLLPIRLMFKLLMVPVWLTLGALGLAAGAVAVPVLLVAIAGVAIVGIVAAVLAVLLPVIPFVLLGLLLWAVFRSRPAVA
jgi:hypothetical protein